MKRTIILFAFSLLIITGCLFGKGDLLPGSPKAEALNEWNSVYDKAEFHKGALLDMKRIIRNADSNIPDLIKITRLIAEVPYHTVPLLHIAEKASHAENGSIDFYSLAELALLKLSETGKVEELADFAAGHKADSDLTEYKKRYYQLKSTADAETVEEASRMVEEMIEKAKQSASSL